MARQRVVGITGGTGFIGSHLAAALAARGDRVRILARDPGKARDLGIEGAEIVEGDLVSSDLFPREGLETFTRGLDAVVHLAGATRARHPVGFWRANVGQTRRLLEALRRGSPGLGRFLAVSSQAVSGPSPDARGFLREDEAPRPLTPYGASKAAMEALVMREPGLPWTIVRPCSVFGPRDRDFLKEFRLVSRGIAPRIGRESLVSLIYVEDLVDALVLALDRPEAAGEILAVSDDEPLSHAELARRAAAILGKGQLRVGVSPALLRVAAFLSERAARSRGTMPLLTRHKARELAWPWWLVSSAKIQSLLGWSPRVGLDEGLRRTLSWYRDAGWL